MTASRAQAEVLFEGYSKVLLGGTHVGFVVQRIEFDAKKKEFLNIYYLKTNQVGGNITESLKARATANLAPLSYQFTELNGDKARTIDATVKGSTLTAVIREAGANPNQAGQAGRANNAGQTVTKKLPKGAFFASFLGYVMLQGKEGIKTGAKYGYQAIAEEDANLYAGEAFISGEESVNGITAFKVLNTFKGARFVSHVTHKGEVIATRSPVQQVATELVGSMAEATAGVALNTSSLEALFGSVPKGAENTIARRSAGAANATAPTGAGAAPVPAQAPALEAEPSPSPAPGSSGASSSGTPSSGTPSPGKSSAGKSSSGQPSAARSKKSVLQATPPSSGESPKKQGVPGGQGIIIKNSLTNQGSSDSQPEPSAQPAQSAPNSQPAQDTERGGSAK